jgi:hypothetical protein
VTARKAAGHVRKHVSSRKHAGTGKHHPAAHKGTATRNAHHVHAKAKHAAHAKGRGFAAAGDFLPVCSFEAVAMSLRLAGQRVTDDEVAGLWELAGCREVSIAEALAAAARFGLAGLRPRGFGELPYVSPLGDGIRHLPRFDEPGQLADLGVAVALAYQVKAPFAHALIVGVDLPGPHAVLATPDGWWSWGRLWAPWPARIEEAWAVTWQ